MQDLFIPEILVLIIYLLGFIKFIQLCRKAPVHSERGGKDERDVS